jgi:acyl carrier protein
MIELMTIEELIKNIAGQLTDQDPSKLSPETILRDIEGFSSLEALFILLMIDDVYKVNITGDDMMEINTIEDLYNLIKSRK